MATGGVNGYSAAQLQTIRQSVLEKLSLSQINVPADQQLSYDDALTVFFGNNKNRPSHQMTARTIDSDGNGKVSTDELVQFATTLDQSGNRDGKFDYHDIGRAHLLNARQFLASQAGQTDRVAVNQRLGNHDFSISGTTLAQARDLLRTQSGGAAEEKTVEALSAFEKDLEKISDPAQKERVAQAMMSLFAKEGTMPGLFIDPEKKDEVYLVSRSITAQLPGENNSTSHVMDTKVHALNLQSGQMAQSTEVVLPHNIYNGFQAQYQGNRFPVVEDQVNKLAAAFEAPAGRRALENLRNNISGALDNPRQLSQLIHRVQRPMEGALGVKQVSLTFANPDKQDGSDITTLGYYSEDKNLMYINRDALLAERELLKSSGMTQPQINSQLAEMLMDTLTHELTHTDQHKRVVDHRNPPPDYAALSKRNGKTPASATPAAHPAQAHAGAAADHGNNLGSMPTPEMLESMRSVFMNMSLSHDEFKTGTPDRVRDYGINQRNYIPGVVSHALTGDIEAYKNQPLETDARMVSILLMDRIRDILAPAKTTPGDRK